MRSIMSKKSSKKRAHRVTTVRKAPSEKIAPASPPEGPDPTFHVEQQDYEPEKMMGGVLLLCAAVMIGILIAYWRWKHY